MTGSAVARALDACAIRIDRIRKNISALWAGLWARRSDPTAGTGNDTPAPRPQQMNSVMGTPGMAPEKIKADPEYRHPWGVCPESWVVVGGKLSFVAGPHQWEVVSQRKDDSRNGFRSMPGRGLQSTFKMQCVNCGEFRLMRDAGQVE